MSTLDYEIFISSKVLKGSFSFDARLQNVSQKLENVMPLSNLHICMQTLIEIPYVLLQALSVEL
jgi:predicted nucleic-acid-binding protein